MRVNHTGEVCAQALYLGQAAAARVPAQRDYLITAAVEEHDHLAWCAARLAELNAHTSYLNPGWFGGAYLIGLLSALLGDRWSMGFLGETERQVVAHLESHLTRLPPADAASRAIVAQMKIDEAKHAAAAVRHGAAELPAFIKWAMRLQGKVMTTIAAYL